MAQFIVDRQGALSNARRTATGGYLVDAKLARVGRMPYVIDGKTYWHFNSPEVLQANLDGLQTAPVTNRHPKRMVDTSNYQEVACGHVVGKPEFKDGMICATLAIQDAKLIQDIEMGVSREVSMGYLAHLDESPGQTPEGEPYDIVRTSIDWNHIAILPAGRAGSAVCLALDSADIPREESDMAVKIKGKEYLADAAQGAIDGLEAELDSLAQEIAKLKAENERLSSEAYIDEQVSARAARAKALKDAADKLEAVKKKYPKISLDGKSEAYIDGLFESIQALEDDGASALQNIATPAPEELEDTAEPQLSPRQKMVQERYMACRGGLQN